MCIPLLLPRGRGWWRVVVTMIYLTAPVSLRLGSVMVLLTPGPQMLLAACARHTDNFLQECVHLL